MSIPPFPCHAALPGTGRNANHRAFLPFLAPKWVAEFGQPKTRYARGGGERELFRNLRPRGDFLSMEIITKVLRVHDPGCVNLSEIQRRLVGFKSTERPRPRLLRSTFIGKLASLAADRRWFWMFWIVLHHGSQVIVNTRPLG